MDVDPKVFIWERSPNRYTVQWGDEEQVNVSDTSPISAGTLVRILRDLGIPIHHRQAVSLLPTGPELSHPTELPKEP